MTILKTAARETMCITANKYSGGITIIFRRHIKFSASHAIAGLFAIPVNRRQPEELVYTDLALIPSLLHSRF